MSVDALRAIADAVLYEGYILWPYRRSALKNQRRFQFGGVYPPAHSARHPDDPSAMQTEVLVSAGARLHVSVRFLHVVVRTVLDAGGQAVDELVAGEQRWQSWQEAVQREVELDFAGEPITVPIAIDAGTSLETLPGAVGAIRRRWSGLAGSVSVRAQPAGHAHMRVRVRIENTTAFAATEREQAVAMSFCSTHTMLHARDGAFVSLTDPPAQLAPAAAACENLGSWPVLAGPPGATDTILSSPIILEDYPRVADESPGDLFDGGEIDGMLVLNILALTDAEKAEMAAADPRTREILERTEALTADQRVALHGTIRPAEAGR